MKRQFVVTVEMPPGVTVAGMADYISEAVAVWAGGKDPESAIFQLNGGAVRVKPVPVPKRGKPKPSAG